MINILFIKVLTSFIDVESRDKREISLFFELGYHVKVICRGEVNEIQALAEGLEYEKFQISLSTKYKIIRIFKGVSAILNWSIIIRKNKPQIISGHDMIGTYIAWLSTIFVPKKRKPKIIYDSHEFELHRNVPKRKRIRKPFIYILERFIIKRSDIVMMVNDSIAEEVQKIYRLKEKPLVIRNMPSNWTLDSNISLEFRRKFIFEFNAKDIDFIVMYHGGIGQGRGIEILISAISQIPNCGLVVLGYGDDEYINNLKELSNEKNIKEQVIFKEAVPIEELWKYVSAADAGMIAIPAVTRSYYFGLPNKLFENIQSLTPIIGSDFPEIRKIIEGYDIGLLVNPVNENEIINAINQMRTNTELYDKFKTNLLRAKYELNWEKEKEKFKKAIIKLKL